MTTPSRDTDGGKSKSAANIDGFASSLSLTDSSQTAIGGWRFVRKLLNLGSLNQDYKSSAVTFARRMDDYREPEILLPSWISKNPFGMAESRLYIVSCFVAGLIGILTIAYTAYQWRRNINLSWMKAIARSKKNPKARSKVPVVPHTWMLESVSRGKSLNCCVCLKSVSPSQALGPMGALDTFIRRCSICGVAAHLGCSSNAHKDCKCVSMVGYEHVIHQWAIRWTEVTDQPDETSFCNYCEEPCSGSFLGGSPIWCCLWCQRLVHVDCQNSISSETGDICDLGPFRRLILSPLFVKELNRCSSVDF
ncbi:Diacylglycerol kinase 1 [Camellia lanceoleosa]|uniref:Diacylglycerol kinase 1 n=1 Tax=Camellia lanceoleosa TaxID=1840588 RepID=A0ACC0FBK4_9ERIC|nr:Diacylglycerol kinase 1 [Camellia lanceoleosa]